MTRAGLVMALTCLLLSALVTAQAKPVLAHEDHGSIYGMVINVGTESMQVQTRTSGYTVGLGSTTQVIRQVVGSGADLRVNARCELHLVPGTSVVSWVIVDRRLAPRRLEQVELRMDTRGVAQAPARDARTAQAHGRPRLTEISGHITRVSGNAITVRDLNGHVATYRLAANVNITVLVGGHLGDISIGEMVKVVLNRAGTTALAVTIMES